MVVTTELLHTGDRDRQNQVSLASRRLAQFAQARYFENELRAESSGDFDVRNVPDRRDLAAITSFVNRSIQQGAIAVILDLPDDKPRIQLISSHRYARYLSPMYYSPNYKIEAKEEGNFSTRLESLHGWQGNGLAIEVRGQHGHTGVFRTKWTDQQDTRRRFAVMTFGQNGWNVVLDFRLEEREGAPVWKINKKAREHSSRIIPITHS